MDIAAAQLAFDRLGRLDRVEVRLARRRRGSTRRSARSPRDCRPGLARAAPGAPRASRSSRCCAAFHFNLAALSYVALLVGLFLVYNTVSTSVIAAPRGDRHAARAGRARARRVLALFLGEALRSAALGLRAGHRRWAAASRDGAVRADVGDGEHAVRRARRRRPGRSTRADVALAVRRGRAAGSGRGRGRRRSRRRGVAPLRRSAAAPIDARCHRVRARWTRHRRRVPAGVGRAAAAARVRSAACRSFGFLAAVSDRLRARRAGAGGAGRVCRGLGVGHARRVLGVEGAARAREPVGGDTRGSRSRWRRSP